MFSKKQPIPVHLKQVYQLLRSPLEHAVSTNMTAGTPHVFSFMLKGEKGIMTIDGMTDHTATFTFTSAPYGCFSLVSNATEPEPGAFRFVRLRVEGETVLDLDFRNFHSVEELEPYFDCYYFSDLTRDREGSPVPIGRFWAFNERGHLHCIRERTDSIPINDCGPTCMLTLRHPPIGDFEAEVGFEQCWRRHGIVFGCEKQKFPYYSMMETWKTAGVQGGFAFVGAHNGSCCVRGALCAGEDADVILQDVNSAGVASYCHKTIPSLEPLFQAERQTTLPYHTLAYCRSGDMTYHFEGMSFTEQAGSVVYLPPSIPCRLEGDVDHLIRIEFDCVEPQTLSPAICVSDRPETIRQLFEELLEAWHSTLPGKEYRTLSIFYRIMAELSRPTPDGTAVAVRLATQYIDTHFTDAGLTVKEVAAAADVSESYLYQLFREANELPPKEYILKCRIHHACRLLKTRYYKVYEVAQKCGFLDAKYFMTVFKKQVGISPSRYIEKKMD